MGEQGGIGQGGGAAEPPRSGEQHLRCKTVHIHHCLKAKPTSASVKERERWSEKMATARAALKMVSRRKEREECNQNP